MEILIGSFSRFSAPDHRHESSRLHRSPPDRAVPPVAGGKDRRDGRPGRSSTVRDRQP